MKKKYDMIAKRDNKPVNILNNHSSLPNRNHLHPKFTEYGS